MTTAEHNDVLSAINALELKLTTAISAAVAALTALITENKLEQERRNATFADRARVDELSSRFHAQTGALSGYELRLTALEKTVQALQDDTQSVQEALSGTSLDLWARLATALGGLLVALVGALVTFLLTHGGLH